jgi:hypothetical protein
MGLASGCMLEHSHVHYLPGPNGLRLAIADEVEHQLQELRATSTVCIEF